MRPEREFDFAIVGAGVSGLSLAWLLAESSPPSRSILLIDGAGDHEQRTLSFWHRGPFELDSLVRREWSTLRVRGPGGARDVTLAEHTYRTLFFSDLQREATRRLRQRPRDLVVDGRLTALEQDSDGVTLSVGDRAFRASWVFDSRFHASALAVDARRHHLLHQHIHGWLVRTERDVLDPRVATLLDFHTDAPAGTAFFYALPFTARDALVEHVSLAPTAHEPALRAYLSSALGVGAFEIVGRESGITPMTERPFERQNGPRVRRIGIAAGCLKPTTGYALTRIVADARAIVRSLETQGHPFEVEGPDAPYAWMDSLLLHVWETSPHEIPRIFEALFARNDPDVVLRFLDEAASKPEIIALAATLPKPPFSRAVMHFSARGL